MSVDDEIVLPGVVSGDPQRANGGSRIQIGMGLGASNQGEEEIADDDEDLEDIEETIYERLMGLKEMMPNRFWRYYRKTTKFGFWFVRRSSWVLGTSLALLALPPFLEQQRIEIEEMQNMQKKQMLLGPGPGQSMSPMQGPR